MDRFLENNIILVPLVAAAIVTFVILSSIMFLSHKSKGLAYQYKGVLCTEMYTESCGQTLIACTNGYDYACVDKKDIDFIRIEQ